MSAPHCDPRSAAAACPRSSLRASEKERAKKKEQGQKRLSACSGPLAPLRAALRPSQRGRRLPPLPILPQGREHAVHPIRLRVARGSNDDFGLRRFFRKNFEPGDFEWAAAVCRWLQRRTEGYQGSRGRRSSTERRRDSENFGGGGRGRIGSGGRRRLCCEGCNGGGGVPGVPRTPIVHGTAAGL